MSTCFSGDLWRLRFLSLLLLTLLSSDIIGFSLQELIECGAKFYELSPEKADLDESLLSKAFWEYYMCCPMLFEIMPMSEATKVFGRCDRKSW